MSPMEITTSWLRHEIAHLKQHSMKYNLIFKLDDTTDIGKEIGCKDSASAVRQFLTQVMHVPKANNIYIQLFQRFRWPAKQASWYSGKIPDSHRTESDPEAG